MPSSKPPSRSPLAKALHSNALSAKVLDCDHHRAKGLHLAVETDYIIEISANDGSFDTYRISKQFSAFRTLRQQLKAFGKEQQTTNEDFPLSDYCLFLAQAIGSEPTSYLAKTSYLSVKTQAKTRRRILNMILTATSSAPFQETSEELSQPVIDVLERFLLTDVISNDDASCSDSSGKLTVDTSSPTNGNAVVPISKRRRLNPEERKHQEKQLSEVLCVSGDEQTKDTTATFASPLVLFPCFVGAVAILYRAREYSLEVTMDVLLLIVAGACLFGRFLGQSKATDNGAVAVQYDTMVDTNPSELLRKSLSTRSTLTVPSMVRPSKPLREFPAGAALGSHTNCWSRPATTEFMVRGPSYQKDRKKVPSERFLCPVSGLDLFLTDACPETVYQNPALLGGKLHTKPRIVINFRLPWGVMLLYGDIPERFVPYLKSKKKPVDHLEDAADRSLAKWFQGDAAYRNERLKIIPSVVDGPWVVRGVVSGRPAILGAKLPVEYHYGNNILEISLDICASAAARGILSVARTYTQVLTLNLGFCIEDVNSEQMLLGVRLHGLNPLEAPEYVDASDDSPELYFMSPGQVAL